MTFFNDLSRLFYDSHSWVNVTLHIPTDPKLLVLLGSSLAIALLIPLSFWLWKAMHGKEWIIEAYDPPDSDWNLVKAGLEGVRKSVTQSARIGSRYTVTLLHGWSSQTVRLEARGIGPTKLQMSHKLIAKLKLEPESQWAQTVAITTPYFRPDLWTFRHPDPNVRLQWRLGAIFMILGVIIPKLLERYFGI